jgi:hypothetical protein
LKDEGIDGNSLRFIDRKQLSKKLPMGPANKLFGALGELKSRSIFPPPSHLVSGLIYQLIIFRDAMVSEPWFFSATALGMDGWKDKGKDLTPYKSYLIDDISQPNAILELFFTCFKSMKNWRSVKIQEIYAINQPALKQDFSSYIIKMLDRLRTDPGAF